MKKMLIVLVLCFSAGVAKPMVVEVDIDHPEKMKATMLAMKKEAGEEKAKKIDDVILGLVMKGVLLGKLDTKDQKGVLPYIKEYIDGKTADEIIALGKKDKKESHEENHIVKKIKLGEAFVANGIQIKPISAKIGKLKAKKDNFYVIPKDDFLLCLAYLILL